MKSQADMAQKKPAAATAPKSETTKPGESPSKSVRTKSRSIASYPLRNIATIAGKEIYAYFASPMAYIVLALFLVANGFLFSIILANSKQANMDSSFADMAIILVFLAPAITMRLLADEQRQGTMELLQTSPVRETEIVLGKWLAAMVLLVVGLALTLVYPAILWKYSSGAMDLGPVWTGYVGMLLLGGTFMAVGLFMSSVTQNQIVAYVLGFGVLLVLWLFQGAAQNFTSGSVAAIVGYLAFSPHFEGFTSGSLQLKDVVFYLSMIVLGLFLCVRSIETKRWS